MKTTAQTWRPEETITEVLSLINLPTVKLTMLTMT
jgi:hypothetical protein